MLLELEVILHSFTRVHDPHCKLCVNQFFRNVVKNANHDEKHNIEFDNYREHIGLYYEVGWWSWNFWKYEIYFQIWWIFIWIWSQLRSYTFYKSYCKSVYFGMLLDLEAVLPFFNILSGKVHCQVYLNQFFMNVLKNLDLDEKHSMEAGYYWENIGWYCEEGRWSRKMFMNQFFRNAVNNTDLHEKHIWRLGTIENTLAGTAKKVDDLVKCSWISSLGIWWITQTLKRSTQRLDTIENTLICTMKRVDDLVNMVKWLWVFKEERISVTNPSSWLRYVWNPISFLKSRKNWDT